MLRTFWKLLLRTKDKWFLLHTTAEAVFSWTTWHLKRSKRSVSTNLRSNLLQSSCSHIIGRNIVILLERGKERAIYILLALAFWNSCRRTTIIYTCTHATCYICIYTLHESISTEILTLAHKIHVLQNCFLRATHFFVALDIAWNQMLKRKPPCASNFSTIATSVLACWILNGEYTISLFFNSGIPDYFTCVFPE